jgi:hypothetical protein
MRLPAAFLAALGLLSWWGFSTGSDVVSRIVLGLGAPLLAIGGRDLAPQAAPGQSGVRLQGLSSVGRSPRPKETKWLKTDRR